MEGRGKGAASDAEDYGGSHVASEQEGRPGVDDGERDFFDIFQQDIQQK